MYSPFDVEALEHGFDFLDLAGIQVIVFLYSHATIQNAQEQHDPNTVTEYVSLIEADGDRHGFFLIVRVNPIRNEATRIITHDSFLSLLT
jgi:hypothetical protein